MLQAFQNPADIWFFPPLKHSRWIAQADWYLNWQLCKGLEYTGLHLPKEVLQVAELYQVEVPGPSPRLHGAPLLVSTAGRLPARNVVVLDNPGALGEWFKEVERVSQGLKAKKIQVFLPASVSQDMAGKAWKKLDCSIEAQFITDTEIA
jgi:hypothetical protein